MQNLTTRRRNKPAKLIETVRDISESVKDGGKDLIEGGRDLIKTGRKVIYGIDDVITEWNATNRRDGTIEFEDGKAETVQERMQEIADLKIELSALSTKAGAESHIKYTIESYSKLLKTVQDSDKDTGMSEFKIEMKIGYLKACEADPVKYGESVAESLNATIASKESTLKKIKAMNLVYDSH